MPDTITEQLNPNEVAAVCRGVLQETKQWQTGRQPSSALVSPAAAVGALGELSPGGALMRGFQEQSLARKKQFLVFLKCRKSPPIVSTFIDKNVWIKCFYMFIFLW